MGGVVGEHGNRKDPINGSRNGTTVRGRRLAAGEAVTLEPGEPAVLGGEAILSVVEVDLDAPCVERAGGADRAPGEAREPLIVPGSAMEGIRERARRIGPIRCNVLVLGATGVGKEIVARMLHAASPRHAGPLVHVNCAALSPSLVESELFGHARGAFTGAERRRAGLVETAHGGTLFLDEVGELPLAAQAKILVVIEQGELLPVGADRARRVDVRVVAATNRDLDSAARRGEFRLDLLYRLEGARIEIPPLCDRRDEIEPLAIAFVRDAAHEQGLDRAPDLDPEAIAWLRGWTWLGNVRELRSRVRLAVALAGASPIGIEHVTGAQDLGDPAPRVGGRRDTQPPGSPAGATPELDRPAVERIQEALAAFGGNQTRAAALLGISRSTLRRRVEEHDLPRPRRVA